MTDQIPSQSLQWLHHRQIFVNSQPPLSDHVTNKQLLDHFSSYKNHFTSAKVIRDKQRKSKGYAILTFTDRVLAEEAVLVYNDSMLQGKFKLNLHSSSAKPKTLAGKEVGQNVGLLPTPEPAGGESEAPRSKKEQFTVKIANLPSSFTRERLGGLLKLYGEIHQLPRINQSKGKFCYAIANFKTLNGAQKAIAGLNKTEHDGQTIRVSFKDGQPAASSTPPSRPESVGVSIVSSSGVNAGPILVPIQTQQTVPLTMGFKPAPTRTQQTVPLNVSTPPQTQPYHQAPMPLFPQAPPHPRGPMPVPPRALPGPMPVPPQAPLHNQAPMPLFPQAPPHPHGPMPVPPQALPHPHGPMLVPPPTQWTVTLDNVDSLVSADELKAMVGVPVEWVDRTPLLPTRVVLHLSSQEQAHMAVQKMNSMNILGKSIQATIMTTPPTLPVGAHPVQKSDSYPAAPPYSQSHDMTPPIQLSVPHSHPVPSVSMPHPQQPPPAASPVPPSLEKTLKLSPPDWNRLMSVSSTGQSLYREVVEPYQSNPSIKITPNMESLSIQFTGHPDAVNSAYGRVCAEVHREITVPDRLRKAALVQLRPDLPTTLQSRYSVTLTGYDDSPSPLKLEGNTSNFPGARQEVETALGGIETVEFSLSLPPHLLNSARERFRGEGIKGCVFNKDTGNSCVVFALVKQDIQRATQVFQSGYFTESIPNVSLDLYNKLAPSVHSQLVEVERQESSMLLKSFVQRELQTVTTSLRQTKESIDLQKSEFEGTSEETAYLIHLHKTNSQVRTLLSSLPAPCTVKKNSLLLKGNPQAIQASQETIRSELLTGVLTHSFVFHCHEKFLSQVEDFVLRPAGEEIICLKQKSTQATNAPCTKPSRGRRKSSSEEGDVEVTLIICSKNSEMFQRVCSYLEEVQPSSKRVTLRKGAVQSIKLNESKANLETKYRVRIISREDSLAVHGLTGREVRECVTEIEERVESSHEIAQHITVTQYQQLFLKIKREQEMAELRGECSELHTLSPRNDGESFSIRIKGVVRRVESVKERLTEMLNSLTTSNFTVVYEQKLQYMWRKRWDRIKKDKEKNSDLIIFIDRQSPTAAQKDERATTTVHIVGTDSDEVDQVGDLISQTQTQTREIKLSAHSSNALRKDCKKEFLKPLVVNLWIKSTEAILTAPEDCGEDLDSAEEEIQKFLGEKTLTHKNLTSSEEVVGLVLNSSKRSAPYMMTATTICKGRGVKVYTLKKPQVGLRLNGTPAAINDVEHFLRRQVIRPIEQSIGQVQLNVKGMLKSVLSTSSFHQFSTKLQEEFCVVCTYPRSVRANKVVRSTLIQPSSTAKCLKLEICSGSLVNEETDAIVNAANEELKHIGGLAKAILDAGGQVIQTESDDYVRERGKVRPGQVVPLGPGKLACKAIIHAVGPRWNGGLSGEESNLYLTVYRSLDTAGIAGYGNISLPAISTGVFTVPMSVCAKASLKAVQDFCQAYPDSTLHTVRFVLYKKDEVDSFCDFFDSSSIVKSASSQASPALSPPPPQPTLATLSQTGVWQWRDDHGSYTPYASDVSKQLSAAHQSQSTYSFTVNTNTYRVDFTTMTQTNLATGHQRQVRYGPTATPTTSGSVQWCYRDDRGGFSPYTPADSQSIESMHQNNSPGVRQIGASRYTFDFARMCQINVSTGYKRPIRRDVQSSASPAAIPSSSPNVAVASSNPEYEPSSRESPAPQADILLTLRGPQDALEAAKARVEKKLNNYVQKETIPVPFTCTADFRSKLERAASKHNVSCTISGGGAGKKATGVVKLEGVNTEVQATVMAIQQLIIDHQVASAESEQDVATPPEWEEQSRTTELFSVGQGSDEWVTVEQKFKATLGKQVASISRIQNTWLWEKYCHHKKRLHLKNNGAVNEKELFHGSRGNDPKVIYEGENGFDMRYSNQGMWGQANYFAVNASYSDNYAYQTPDGYKEMFLVKVLTGDSYQCASNSSLRKPPEKPQNYGVGGGKVQFSKMDYDTVTGTTYGCQVYMTYDNDKAYPAYLVKYR